MPLPGPFRITFIAIALFVTTLLVFSRALSGGFVNCDDPDYVTKNARVQEGISAKTVQWAFTSTAASNWHPLTWISHALDQTLFGRNATGHHATSVVFHALNATLVFLVLSRLTGAVWTSAFCAALFAWHPLRVESVAWVAERKDVLGGFFWWLTLGAYALYIERSRPKSHSARPWYAVALTTFALGLLSKPVLVTLPCVLLLLDFWPLNRLQLRPAITHPEPSPAKAARRQKRDASETSQANANQPPISLSSLLLEKVPFFLLSAGSCLITYVAQQGGGAVSEALPLNARLANALVAIPRYVGDFFWPTNLAILYPHPGFWPGLTVAGAITFILITSLVALRHYRRRPWITIGWLWFLGTLVPMSGVVQVGLQSMADRYTYLPIVGLQIALCWSVSNWAASAFAKKITAALGTAALLVFAIATWRQQSIWKNSFTLFEHAIRVTRGNYFCWNNLGTAYSDGHRYAEAIPCYRESLAIKADYDLAQANLAHALAETGALPEALDFFRSALRLKPDLPAIHCNYGNALSDAGQFDEAIAQFQFVLSRQPDDEDALNGYGLALARQGKTAEAEEKFRTALAHPGKPGSTDTRANLATLYAMTGRLDEAIREYRAILAVSPGEAQVHNNLANALAGRKALPEAVEHYHRALQLEPLNPEAHYNLGIALLQLGQPEEAKSELHLALAQRPDYPQARAALRQIESAASPTQ